MRALLEIALARRGDGGERVADVGPEPAVRDLEALLEAGQADGVFRDFELRPMALLLSQAVDGVLLQLATRPDIDLDLWAREISHSVDLATRSAP